MDDQQRARELSSPEDIAFRLRNLAQNMVEGNGPVARDHQAWKRVEELADAVAALRAAPEGFVIVPVEPTPEMIEAYHSVEAVTASNDEDADDQWAIESWRAMLAARPQEASDA